MPRISGPSGRAAARGGDRTRRTRQSSPSGLERTARDRPPKGAAPRRARRTVGETPGMPQPRATAAQARPRPDPAEARSRKPEAGSRKPKTKCKKLESRAGAVSRASFGKNPGGVLLSHTATRAVPSAPKSLTSEFGMGSGVASSKSPPETVAPLSRAMRELVGDSPVSRPRAGPNLFLDSSALSRAS